MDRDTKIDNSKAPWLDEKEWGDGIAKDIMKSTHYTELWFATIFILIFFIPLGFGLYSYFLKNYPHLIWISYILPSLALLLLIVSIGATIHSRKIKTRFELKTFPGILGGYLRGAVRTTVPLTTVKHLSFQLTCMEICQASNMRFGGNARWESNPAVYSANVLYFEEGTIPVGQICENGKDYTFPIEIGIPYSYPQTKFFPSNPWVEWRLQITAHKENEQFMAEFMVPVFMTPESDPNFNASTTSQSFKDVSKSLYDVKPNYAGVSVRQDQLGTHFYFGPGRCVTGAMFSTIITIVVCSAAATLYWLEFNRILVSVFALLSVWGIAGTFHSWLYTTIVDIEHRYLTFRKGYLGIYLSKTIYFDDINEIKPEKIGAEFNKHDSTEYMETHTESVIYNLALVLKDNKQIRIAKYLSEKYHAEWLAEKMTSAIRSSR